jgi:hypothetical protein
MDDEELGSPRERLFSTLSRSHFASTGSPL